jgi:hypothetical protein
MRKIHKLLLQDIILSHEHLYESKSKCGYLTDKDTVHCDFRKELIFNCRYKGENSEIHVMQVMKVSDNEYPYNQKYTYAVYHVSVQIGFLSQVFSGQKAINEMKQLLNEYQR